jgi:hypothetical protein
VRITLKKPYADGTVAVDMDPLWLLCQLATCVPPPRFHTVHYAGVLAPASQWRSRLAPAPPLPAPAKAPAEGDESGRASGRAATARGRSCWRAASKSMWELARGRASANEKAPILFDFDFDKVSARTDPSDLPRMSAGMARISFRAGL